MEDVFKYPDTNSSRAQIDYLNRKFKGKRIAIIGLGGTGSYILDFVAKTPVAEIHIFDKDTFEVHNAFRAPGAPAAETFEAVNELKKVAYLNEIYSRMRHGIVVHDEYVTNDNISQLAGFDFVFICIDKNEARSNIINGLLRLQVPFIDAGMGINKVGDSLIGTVRVTTGTAEKNDHIGNRIGSVDDVNNEYSTNIQMAELNCLNAVLAVMKWKKMLGFYQNLKQEHNTLYFINTNKILNEDY